MSNQLFEPDLDPHAFNQMLTVMRVALGKILNEASLDDFLDWAQFAIPSLANIMFSSFEELDRPKMAYWMGVNLWNSAPQPSNHFKPLPLEKPSRNSACPCGSGLKYKHCCIHLPLPEKLPTDIFWSLMVETMPKAQINRLVKDHQLPINAIAIMASHFSDDQDHTQVIKMLNPLFEGNASHLNHHHSGLLDRLCDSYNAHYKTDKKKQDLLQRMSQHKDRTIRAEAWQRIASWQLDLGDFSSAMDALNIAMQAQPDNPGHSLLELTLLVSSNQLEQAKQRAAFWWHKLKHYEFEYPDLIETLARAQTDPKSALQTSLNQADNDPRLIELLQWIVENADLPVAQYQLEEIETDDDEEELPYPDPMQNAVTLIPTDDIFELEVQWQDITPINKPFGTQLDPMEDSDVWGNIINANWLDFLLVNPEAINSLIILDDLVTLIYIHPDNNSLWGPLENIQPLLERGEAIVLQADIPEHLSLPWVMPENRPALRLLVHRINLAMNQDKHQYSIQQIKLYLRLNPHDNHGYRSLLINHYLQHNQDLQALALAAHYPDDMLAETHYGKVLAHYRLGDLAAAEQALQTALETLPLVAEYLIKARVAQPELSEYGITYGGKDQAWFYRDEMRETWVQAEGCLAWLKKQLKS